MEREKNIKKLSELIELKTAKIIEDSIYDFSKKYTDDNETPFLLDSIYTDKFNEIFNLLISKKSCFLIDAIKSNKIDPKKIAFMRPDELNPEKYEAILKRKELEEFKKSNQTTSSVFKCTKCKEKKCNVVQKQTRAADEPTTLFVECKACGHTTVIND